MSFHPSLLVFVSVGLCATGISALLAIVVEKLDAALTSPHRTAAVHWRKEPKSTWQATSR